LQGTPLEFGSHNRRVRVVQARQCGVEKSQEAASTVHPLSIVHNMLWHTLNAAFRPAPLPRVRERTGRGLVNGSADIVRNLVNDVEAKDRSRGEITNRRSPNAAQDTRYITGVVAGGVWVKETVLYTVPVEVRPGVMKGHNCEIRLTADGAVKSPTLTQCHHGIVE
jgi:hypothetical protein